MFGRADDPKVHGRAWLRLAQFFVVLLLFSGSALALAPFLPPSSSPGAAAAQGSGDDDLGPAVERMVAGREEAGDQYARLSAAVEQRLDKLVAAWNRVSATVAGMTWLERLTAIITLAVALCGLRYAPAGMRLLRRRLLDAF